MSDFSIRLARPADGDAFHEVEQDAATLLSEEPSLRGVPLPPAESADNPHFPSKALISLS
ncbi:hypothetical protein [Qipengyuania oceanensis]|uniref:Uncharacterized protein n=1 Tax=Qipengyuania oceanensis TaxID=1463597 RepID=A0A844YFM1_9SPHN|nr:hypothetical protein [Qipengyuania oceanensis]MXO63976.1 hypothetical protein [Qipengyuania oceanensis]